MRVGIDIDDTVYNFDAAAREVFLIQGLFPNALNLPRTLTEDQRQALKNGDHWDEWNGILSIVGKENWEWLWEHVDDVALFQRGLPLKGAIDALQVLAERGHEIWLMTARQQRYSHQTFNWLSRFRCDIAGVVHGPSKWDIASDLGFGLIVDDGPGNLAQFLNLAREPIYGGGKGIYNAWIYGIKRYEPVKTFYRRFRYVNSLTEVVADSEEWEHG
jgi:hypothetical protein